MILLEIDITADVTALVRDTMRGVTHRSSRTLEARKPAAFLLSGLQPDTHYQVCLEDPLNLHNETKS
jgi:hypothetical protein